MASKTKANARKKASAERKMVVVRTPNKAGSSWRVDAIKYEAMRKTLMRVLPRKAPGLTQQEMWDSVALLAPKEYFPTRGKAGWWMKGGPVGPGDKKGAGAGEDQAPALAPRQVICRRRRW